MHYPDNYAAFVSIPMDWETCHSHLKNRNYETVGRVVADLCLIFANVKKYNMHACSTDTVSGKAYNAAVAISAPLEAAVDV